MDTVTTDTAKTTNPTGFNYSRLITQFGTQEIDSALLERFSRLSKLPLHHFLKRKIFFSHRDLGNILDAVEQNKPFYLYTGRGPSSESMHLGHLVPFLLTRYLQQALDVPLVIQMTDDEKFLFKSGLTLEETTRLAKENAKDILALGFDSKKTFLFTDTAYVGHMYPNIVKIEKCITANQVQAAMGLTGEDNIGKYVHTAIQSAPAFASSFPDVLPMKDMYCLIPCAIDQDPFFRICRDVAHRVKERKPAVIHSKFFPALSGLTAKMSASEAAGTIYLTDTPAQIKKKINKSFSGGRDTLEEQRRFGANIEVDVPVQYLRFFLEDDARLKEIEEAYSTGKMLTGEVKAILIELLQHIVAEHQRKRALITDEQIEEFMTIRKLQ